MRNSEKLDIIHAKVLDLMEKSVEWDMKENENFIFRQYLEEIENEIIEIKVNLNKSRKKCLN